MYHKESPQKTPMAIALLVAFAYTVAFLMTADLLYLVMTGKF